VHFGSVVDGIYAHGASRDDIDDGKGDWAVRVLQITSSPIKNVKKNAFVDKRWWTLGETDAANAGESTIRMDEYGTKSLSDGTAIAMRANVQALSGKLGRETFVFENHFCVVDLPLGEAAPVTVSFVGTTVPHLDPFMGGFVGGSVLAEAKAQLNKRNDPGLFESSKWAKTTPEAFTGWLAPVKIGK
jgi:hypothetical protein